MDRMARIVDRVMWHRDEDGEWRHRLWREHSGEDVGRTVWASPWTQTRYTTVSTGVAWTHWVVGISVETDRTAEWTGSGHTPIRRSYVTAGLGPIFLTVEIVRPRRPDPFDAEEVRDRTAVDYAG